MQQAQRAALVESHAWIVAQFVAYYSNRGRRADLREAGLLGLCEAAQRYNPGRGVKFGTYAWNYVKGCMLEELRLAHVVPVSKRAALGKTLAPVAQFRTVSLNTSGQGIDRGALNTYDSRPGHDVQDLPPPEREGRKLQAAGVFIEEDSEQKADVPRRRKVARRCVAQLPTSDHRRVAFRALKGRSVEQIARALEMPPGRVVRLLGEAERQLEREAA